MYKTLPLEARRWAHNFLKMNSVVSLKGADRITLVYPELDSYKSWLFIEYSKGKIATFRGSVSLKEDAPSSLQWLLRNLPDQWYDKYASKLRNYEAKNKIVERLCTVEGLTLTNCKDYLRKAGYDLEEPKFVADYTKLLQDYKGYVDFGCLPERWSFED